MANILYITPCNPLSQNCGTAVRANSIFHALRTMGDVTCLVLDVWGSSRTAEDSDMGIRFISPYESFKFCLLRRIYSIFAILGLPTRWMFVSEKMVRSFCGLGARNYDFAVVSTLCMTRTAIWRVAPSFVDADDSFEDHFNVFFGCKFRSRIVRSIVRWGYVRRQLAVCALAKGTWFANPKDAVAMRRVMPCQCLPNIPRTLIRGDDVFSSQQMNLCIVGALSYRPNRDGVAWFLKKSWPDIRSSFPDLTCSIVGGGLPDEKRREWLGIPGVELLGFVDDLGAVYARSCAVVSPLLEGGGTSIKIFEAAKCGCKIFASPVSVRGLDEGELTDLRIDIFKDSKEFCRALQRWMSVSGSERGAVRKEIFDKANKMFSQDRIVLAIKNLIGEFL